MAFFDSLVDFFGLGRAILCNLLISELSAHCRMIHGVSLLNGIRSCMILPSTVMQRNVVVFFKFVQGIISHGLNLS